MFWDILVKIQGSSDFWNYLNYFSIEKSMELVHTSIDWVHVARLTGPCNSLNVSRSSDDLRCGFY
jgi:hypothetical protein